MLYLIFHQPLELPPIKKTALTYKEQLSKSKTHLTSPGLFNTRTLVKILFVSGVNSCEDPRKSRSLETEKPQQHTTVRIFGFLSIGTPESVHF